MRDGGREGGREGVGLCVGGRIDTQGEETGMKEDEGSKGMKTVEGKLAVERE